MKKVAELIHKYGCTESNERVTLRRKWLQVCMHSIIYYKYDTSLWTDARWMQTSKEVIKLRDDNPGLICSMPFSDDLRIFDGSTGFNLDCLSDEGMMSTAQQLIKYKGEINNVIRLRFENVRTRNKQHTGIRNKKICSKGINRGCTY